MNFVNLSKSLENFIDFNELFDINYLNYEEFYYLAVEIINFSKCRPFLQKQFVFFCLKLKKNINDFNFFKSTLIKYGLIKNPYLILQLYFENFFFENQILEILNIYSNFNSFFYFKNIFKSEFNHLFNDYFNPEIHNDELIEFGWSKKSIGFILKYDEIYKLQELNNFNIILNWSPFEISYEPNSKTLFSISCHFGSIRCIKFLLIQGFNINDDIIPSLIFSNSIEFFSNILISKENIFYALKFRRNDLIKWFNNSNILNLENSLLTLNFSFILNQNFSNFIFNLNYISDPTLIFFLHLIFPNIIYQNYKTPIFNRDDIFLIHYLIILKNIFFFEYLFLKININTIDKNFLIPLIYAFDFYPNIVYYLIKKGSNIHFKDNILFYFFLNF